MLDYASEKLALEIAKILKLPEHLISYEVRFATNEIATAKYEFEIWLNGKPNIVDEKIERLSRTFEITVTEKNTKKSFVKKI